jgi:glycosyltransferase involved in cell wall biosynthesis
MPTPKVSVILPVYNQEKLIALTIESVLAQTYTNFELVILDDGSTDNTASILKQYAEKDERIRTYFHKNEGRAKATNKVANLATGEILALLDADDLMLPERLQKQVAFLQANPEIQSCGSHCLYIDENGKWPFIGMQIWPDLKTIEDWKEARATKRHVRCAITSMIIYKDVYLRSGGLDGRFWPCDDLEYVNRLVDQGYIILTMQEALTKYRVHSNSTTLKKAWELFFMLQYTCTCMDLRRNNQQEPSVEEFKAAEDRKPFVYKLKQKMKHHGTMYHVKASFSLNAKLYWKLPFQFALATLLVPDFMIATIKKKLSI